MTRSPRPWPATAVAAALACICIAGAGPAAADGAADLKARHDALKQQLAASPFGRPLVLDSSATAADPHGDVYAVVDRPFAGVAAALRRPDRWCDVLLLQTNVKRCVPAGSGDGRTLQVAIARKSEQTAAEAFQVEFRYAVKAADADYLAVQMAAAAGPVGTRDYRLGLEAVPLDAQHTFLHMSYAYANGVAARMATDAYLATAGREKVGFSVAGRDEAGKPRYVDGVRGIAERNTMRYFLAIEAVLGALSAPPEQQVDRRLRAWYAATERYPRQLHELSLDDYLAMKRREVPVATAARNPPDPT